MARTKGTPPPPPAGETIVQCAMEEVMHQSMLPYSEYVILERALPRVEDGLKPVQRRILYTMYELGLSPDKPHRKCARIVGDCLGKYHPHGDSSVYDALARMAQPFVMRGLLVDGHGNFGSIDGDSPAAMRYTEARMTPLAMELLQGIEKDTVSFHLNFDDTQKEPDLLPGRYPQPAGERRLGHCRGPGHQHPAPQFGGGHRRGDRPDREPGHHHPRVNEVPARPGFPHRRAAGGRRGNLCRLRDRPGQAAPAGPGPRGTRPAGRSLLVITQVPYQVNKAQMLEKILRLSEEKKGVLGGIHDIRDESDRTGMRAVIELKKDVDPEKALAALYKYSDLQVTFGVNMVAIAGGKPVQMGLKEIIAHYIGHQRQVVARRTRYDLEHAQARAHVLEGLIVAVDNLDEVIRLIRASKTPKEAKERLMSAFKLTESQAQAILDMRLQRLTNLEILTLRQEYAQLLKEIARLEAILKSESKLLKVIRDELTQIRAKYADPRRTQIARVEEAPAMLEEEKPLPEETWVVVSRAGFFKRVSPRLYDKYLAAGEEGRRPCGGSKPLPTKSCCSLPIWACVTR